MNTKIEATAAALRAQGPEGFPVDVRAIATARGITVREEPLEEAVSGMLVVREGRAVIVVNAHHHENRKRFSISHEIGHEVLHSQTGRVFVDAPTQKVFYRDRLTEQGTDHQEIEANALAAELLMPRAVLEDLFGNRQLDPTDEGTIRQLAAQFGVSTLAMSIRLATLGLVATK